MIYKAGYATYVIPCKVLLNGNSKLLSNDSCNIIIFVAIFGQSLCFSPCALGPMKKKTFEGSGSDK